MDVGPIMEIKVDVDKSLSNPEWHLKYVSIYKTIYVYT